MEAKPLPQDNLASAEEVRHKGLQQHSQDCPGNAAAAPKNRRQILGSVAALLAAPLVLGKDALVHTFLPKKSDEKPAENLPRPSINPPAHSVKRG
jgi:hypothetical protein